jgi:HEPN domain-containing protein
MQIDANTYKVAAEEHVVAARELHSGQRYVLAHYIAGLAVECILRAYFARRSEDFDKRHDLRELAKSSRFLHPVPFENQRRVWIALNTCVAQWLNNHRYRSEAALRRYLKAARLDGNIRGDFVKERSRRIVDAAHVLVGAGVQSWPT